MPRPSNTQYEDSKIPDARVPTIFHMRGVPSLSGILQRITRFDHKQFKQASTIQSSIVGEMPCNLVILGTMLVLVGPGPPVIDALQPTFP